MRLEYFFPILTQHIKPHVYRDWITNSVICGALIDASLLSFQLVQSKNGSIANAGWRFASAALQVEKTKAKGMNI